MEHESDGNTNCNWCARYTHQGIDTGTVKGTIIPGQSGPGSNGKEVVLQIPQSSRTEA